MKNISIVGAGTMGNGIAHTFAQFGYKVSLIDISNESLEKGLKTIEANLNRQLAKGTIDEEKRKSTLDNITPFNDLATGVEHAELVLEAATENTDLKLLVFKDLDSYCSPETILATNTSSISITRIASATRRPEQVIGMHFMNPVPLMRLVEVIRGYNTSNQVTASVMDLARKLDKDPVEVRDYPGFVSNRILMPMINEAVYALHEGVAGVSEIDTVMKLGMAHPMGPLQLADFIGLDVCLSIMRVLYEGFSNPKYAPCPLLINMVTAGRLGVKSGEGFYDYSEGTKNARVSEMFL